MDKAEQRAQEALKMSLKERLQHFSFAHLYKGRFPRASNLELENHEDITDALLKEMQDIDRLEFIDSDEEMDSEDSLEYEAVGFESDVSFNGLDNTEAKKFLENNKSSSTQNCSSSNHVDSAISFAKIQNKKPKLIKPTKSKQNTSATILLETPKQKVKVSEKKHKIENDANEKNQENDLESSKPSVSQSTDSITENCFQRKNDISIEDEDTVPLDITNKIIAENKAPNSHQSFKSLAKNLTFDGVTSSSNTETQDQTGKLDQSKEDTITENIAKMSGKKKLTKEQSKKRKLDNSNHVHKATTSENRNETSSTVNATGNDNSTEEIHYSQKKIKKVKVTKDKSKIDVSLFTKIDVIPAKKSKKLNLDESTKQIENIKTLNPHSENYNECSKSSVESNSKEITTERANQDSSMILKKMKKIKVPPTTKNLASDVAVKQNLSSNNETRVVNSHGSSKKKLNATARPFKVFKLPLKDTNPCKFDEKNTANQFKGDKNSEISLNDSKDSTSNSESNKKISNDSETKVVPTFSTRKNDKVVANEGNVNSDKLNISPSSGKSGLKKICNGVTAGLRKIKGSTHPFEDKVDSKKKLKQMKPISKKNSVVNGLSKNVSQKQSNQKVTLTNNIQNNYNMMVPEEKSCLNDEIQNIKSNEKSDVITMDKNDTETDKNGCQFPSNNENCFTIEISDEEE